jgi:hypothetical protein
LAVIAATVLRRSRVERAERIEQAIADWHERRFPGVPGETSYIPLSGSA